LVGMVLGARWGPLLAIESTSISPKSAHFILFLLSQHPKLGLVSPTSRPRTNVENQLKMWKGVYLFTSQRFLQPH
jgi:hypothetical protein